MLKRLWLRVRDEISRDDLFWRVLLSLCGLGTGGIGVVIVTFQIRNPDIGWGWHVVAGVIALLLLAWDILLIARCFAPAGSRLSRHADPLVNLEMWPPSIAITILVLMIPVLVLSILLRVFGVTGSHAAHRKEPSGDAQS